jgi:hypothetical protein
LLGFAASTTLSTVDVVVPRKVVQVSVRAGNDESGRENEGAAPRHLNIVFAPASEPVPVKGE